MSKNIYDHILKIIFVRSKFRRTKYAQIISMNRSDFTLPQDGEKKPDDVNCKMMNQFAEYSSVRSGVKEK